MMAELRDKVKSGEELWRVSNHSSPLATPVFIGVSGESVKSEEQVGLHKLKVFSQSQLENGKWRQVEIFLPTYHFVPGNGKKLPQ